MAVEKMEYCIAIDGLSLNKIEQLLYQQLLRENHAVCTI